MERNRQLRVISQVPTRFVWQVNAERCAACSALAPDGQTCGDNGKRYIRNVYKTGGCPRGLHDDRAPETVIATRDMCDRPTLTPARVPRLSSSWMLGMARLRWQMATERVLRNRWFAAAIKIVGAIVGSCAAGAAIVKGRLVHCEICEHRRSGWLGWFARCAKCGCVLRWKTRLAMEGCPVEKWSRVEPEHCAGIIRRLYTGRPGDCGCGRKRKRSEDA
ncbi:MAG: hypothetical protein H6819_06655 [Phycisphaerales bacterium]|nr:hypothetical protein [Phycisphaerales bacterium]MCB9855261.1 hypothetical protein [Phycisphaerales bacterium]MCB9862854.1 hypothetical protein [Phycisphaerales bacterium]